MNDAFKQWYVDTEFDPMSYGAMQAAWNAALEHAANICREQMLKSDWPRTPNDCAEAIHKEKTE